MKTDTICAIATAPGGAIGIVRVSGPQAVEAVSSIFEPQGGHPMAQRPAREMVYGKIVGSEGTAGEPAEVVDEAMAVVFRAPHSYTGEDSAELSCHGSPYILHRVLTLLMRHGCRLAAPGEFTQRAFLNGKMDLAQAEAVADLVAATSRAAHRMAISQLRGGLSRALDDLRQRILHLTTLLELEIDFSDHEDLEFADRDELHRLVDDVQQTVGRLVDSFRVGHALKEGVPVALVGETNAGKSTLLNALLHDDRAIVSPIHGTTRDTVEDTLIVDGILFRLIDTAGIRLTRDPIEQAGIDRTFQSIDRAEIVLWLIDATQAREQWDRLAPQVLPHCQGHHLIVLLNKVDLLDSPAATTITGAPSAPGIVPDTSNVPGILAPNSDIPNPTPSAFTLTQSAHAYVQSAHTHLPSGIDIPLPTSNDNSLPLGNDTPLPPSTDIPLPPDTDILAISARQGTGLDRLRQLLTQIAGLPTLSETDVIVTNARHHQALTQALDAITRVQTGLAQGLSPDLLSEDFRLCNAHLADILHGGAITSQETLNHIFSSFCIGK